MKTFLFRVRTMFALSLAVFLTFLFRVRIMLGLSLAVFFLPAVTMAGTGGAEFTTAYDTITAWLTGDLGRLIAAALLVVGLVAGVMRQSIMAAVPAVACGLVATLAPGIIDTVVTAVI